MSAITGNHFSLEKNLVSKETDTIMRDYPVINKICIMTLIVAVSNLLLPAILFAEDETIIASSNDLTYLSNDNFSSGVSSAIESAKKLINERIEERSQKKAKEKSKKIFKIDVANKKEEKIETRTKVKTEIDTKGKNAKEEKKEKSKVTDSEQNYFNTNVHIYSVNEKNEEESLGNATLHNDYDNSVDSSFVDDDGDGVIEIEGLLNSAVGSMSINLSKDEFLETRAQIVLDREESGVEKSIPMLEAARVDELIKSVKFEGDSQGLLLIKLNSAEDCEIDGEHDLKIALDNGFKVTQTTPVYYLFVGITPGNLMVHYKINNEQTLSKLINVRDSGKYKEMFFDELETKSEKQYQVKFLMSTLLGGINNDFYFSDDQIELYQSDSRLQNIANNYYEYFYPQALADNQHFIKINMPQLEMFVDKGERSNEVEIPSDDYVEYIMKLFKVDDDEIETSCFVQINLAKDKEIVRINPERNSLIDINPLVLTIDSDGTKGGSLNDVNINTKKIFLYGENNGVINYNVEYIDGTSDYLQTFCSKNTYIVQQL